MPRHWWLSLRPSSSSTIRRVSSAASWVWLSAVLHQCSKSVAAGRPGALLASCRSSCRFIGTVCLLLQVEGVVGLDNQLDQWMAYHVGRVEKGKAQAFDILQHMQDMLEAGLAAARQVNLGNIAGNDCGRAETYARQEHFHLCAGGVLAFVQDDKAVVQGAATHICQRGYLNNLTFNQPVDVVGPEHFVEGIVEGAQVRVDFLAQVSRQKAKLFARFHGWTYQQDALNGATLQSIHRTGYRKIGFAGTSRTDTKVDIVLLDRADVALLIAATWSDGLFARAQRDTVASGSLLCRYRRGRVHA